MRCSRMNCCRKHSPTLDEEYVKAWQTWPAADTAGRERLWQAVNVLGKVRDHLGRVLADGKLAQREFNDLIHKRQ